MKKLLIILFLFSFYSLRAQQKSFSGTSFNYSGKENKNIPSIFSIDTLKPASFSKPCYVNPQTSLVIYTADYVAPFDSGFVSGNNVYGDLEKAQRYNNSSSLTITGCAVLLNRAASTHSVTVGAKAKLYNYTTQVGSLLATSSLVQTDSLNNKGYTIFNFPSSINVSGNFLMSIELPSNTGDTMAIYCTKVTCNSGSSFSWERAVDTTWGTIHTNWNFKSGDDIDLAIFPLYSSPTNISENNFTNDISVFPNPSNGEFVISGLDISSQIQICDVFGRVFFETSAKGKQETIKLSNANGIYFVRIASDSQSVIRKLIISK